MDKNTDIMTIRGYSISFYLMTTFSAVSEPEWYGILGFNVPLDSEPE